MIEDIKNLRAWLRWEAGVLTILASTAPWGSRSTRAATPAVAMRPAVS